ncbi:MULTISPECIES: LysR substrate-binding domain-containing protein [unclassified Variovorax]|jgi:DNA-binding transcriptional LysR family regulator|uniref:LysR substrate-binding domain-containing protein n=1 Tax=unclassified Variovorax TaxID=663243 RepID=UPI00089AB423|nr:MULTISPECIES: LysR substrate-binding domain-containing protein [unclassified Variovorax]SDW78384.1 transcriptional regulator, LysR family [Variovorax sp. YR634]SDZ54039.1 transcriptional regulator, LysR family [Variovorax sp. YR266]SET75199.1 transcriptional regulator, LysR family [Variovorax sp. OV084]SOD26779.1 transcriptional regulator, LysR family [Variovorax sp. YR752]
MNQPSMDRGDLALVLAIRDHGSLAGAAATLDVVPSVITKRLGALEARLGQRLFDRTTRRLSVTAEGEAVCLHARTLLDGFAALESELGERQNELTGTVRLAATFGFGRRWLGPAVAAFQARHPALQIELMLTEQLPDLGAEGYDGAVWLWAVQQRHAADWVSRRIARNQRVLAASPGYLKRRGTPATVEALASHDCLVARENGDASQRQYALWTLRHARDGSTARVRVQGPLASNSGEMVRDWCVAGHGVMLRSLWDIAPQLASGELVRVLPQYAMAEADIHWIAPWRPKTPRRVRLLVDHLVEQFRGEPWKPGKAGAR